MAAPIALITGIVGQDGSYVSRLLIQKGYHVIGLKRSSSSLTNNDWLGVTREIEYIDCDLQDEAKLTTIIARYQPAELYHLGGLSAPGASWADPKNYTTTNVLGALTILEAIRLHSPKTKLFNAATSEMFGNSHQQGFQSEQTPFLPTNPYAVTKIYAYWMANIYRQSYSLFIANSILFSHESPLRGEQFVTRKISQGVAKIKLGLAKTINLGNIESKRDWGFAGDYVEAMWRMLQQPKPDDFVLSTGQVHSIREFLTAAFAVVGISNWELYITNDPKFYRPIDLNNLYGSNSKAKQVLGWQPQCSFEQLVAMMVEADLKRLQ